MPEREMATAWMSIQRHAILNMMQIHWFPSLDVNQPIASEVSSQITCEISSFSLVLLELVTPLLYTLPIIFLVSLLFHRVNLIQKL